MEGWFRKGIRDLEDERWGVRDDENGVENGSIYRCCSTPIMTIIGTITAVMSDYNIPSCSML